MKKSISVTRIDELDEQVVKIDKSWVLMRRKVYNKLIRTLTAFTNTKETELLDGKFYAVKTREVAIDTKYEDTVRKYQEIREVLIPDLLSMHLPDTDKHRSLMLRLADLVEKYNDNTRN